MDIKYIRLIRPCSNCVNSENIIICRAYDYYIQCKLCRVQTSSYKKINKAIKEWNNVFDSIWKKVNIL